MDGWTEIIGKLLRAMRERREDVRLAERKAEVLLSASPAFFAASAR